jgi:hypothetical protein
VNEYPSSNKGLIFLQTSEAKEEVTVVNTPAKAHLLNADGTVNVEAGYPVLPSSPVNAELADGVKPYRYHKI